MSVRITRDQKDAGSPSGVFWERHEHHVDNICTFGPSNGLEVKKQRKKNSYFRNETVNYLRFLVPENCRILALGCGDGETLARLKPCYGLGVDINQGYIEFARNEYPEHEFLIADIEDPEFLKRLANQEPFDVILLEDTLGYLEDVHSFLQRLGSLCIPETRVVSVYYGYMWEPLLQLAEKLNLRKPSFDTTWLRMSDIDNFMTLGGFETVKKEWRVFFPMNILGIANFVNRYIATLPLIRKLCLRHYLVARRVPVEESKQLSVSVVVPCRNEMGNIEPALQRLPKLGSHTELIFVEGHSTDSTWEEIQRVKREYKNLDIKSIQQPGVGKRDAVRAGFNIATGDVLMILDADLTVPPEDLTKFFDLIKSGQGEYINGSRLIYGMEDQAMRFLNYVANHTFAYIFSYLINQRLTDTLCGTKVLKRSDYNRIAQNRNYFGDFDPFGDFDLIFGASKINLKICEVPVRYATRSYGTTQISRFRHGFLLVKMVLFAYKKFKVC